MFYWNGNNNNYFQVQLLDSLKINKFYFIEFYVANINNYRLSCNNVALLLTNQAIYADTINNIKLIPANPQVYNYGNPIISDTNNWVKVSTIYKAKGGEQFITLGNFNFMNQTNYIVKKPLGYFGAGYFVDDVSVIPLDSIHLQADAGRDTVITKGDSAWIGSCTNGIDTLNWIQNGVTVIDSTRPGFWVYPTTNTFYVLIQTINGYTSRDTVFVGVQTLPVTLLSFNVSGFKSFNGNTNTFVKWETATEVNVSHFNVQRSVNSKDFNNIGTVNAKGASSYTFIDNTNLAGVVYYRLEIVDRNGDLSYSEVKELRIDIGGLIISPNPAKDFITISGGNIKEVKISDVSGRVLLVGNTNKVDVRGLASGVYYITMQTKDGRTELRKLLKR